MKRWIVILGLGLLSVPAWAKLKVVCSTPDLRSLAAIVAGQAVELGVLCPAGSDPHYLEARPSQIVRVRRADLLVSNGAELELGWLPALVAGAQRPDLAPGASRHFQASDHVDLIDVPVAGTGRDAGDVHAQGNPHFMLDPLRASKAGLALAEKLAELDPEHAAKYRSAAAAFDTGMRGQVKAWQARVARRGLKHVVAYHKDLNYLLERLGLEPGIYIEPKPGLPPTARHLAALVDSIRAQKIPLAVISNFYPSAPAEKLAAAVPGFRWVRVPGQVGSMPGADDLPGLYEQVVLALERP